MSFHKDAPSQPYGKLITQAWLPLAASWLLMGLERPIVSALMARLEDPAINLAAYASVVFPLSVLIESPIIMILAASTALSKDWTWYCFLRNIMVGIATALTLLHAIVAFTPLFDFIVLTVLKIPDAVVEPARLGMMLMTPWTASIAIRRFQQGVLIRFERSEWIGIGTLIRLTALCAGLSLGFRAESPSGIVVATFAISLGVLSEAIFIRIGVQPILNQLKHTPVNNTMDHPQFRKFLQFYIPLATTPLLSMLALPITSAALSRLPLPIYSFAVWPILGGLVFLFNSIGLAYQEVVVALIEKPNYFHPLRRFTIQLAVANSAILFLVTISPLSEFWFVTVSGLSQNLSELAQSALPLAILLPGLNVIQSWYQGILVHSHETRGIIEAMALYVLVSAIILGGGIYFGTVTGIYMGYIASLSGFTAQIIWLRFRCRRFLKFKI